METNKKTTNGDDVVLVNNNLHNPGLKCARCKKSRMRVIKKKDEFLPELQITCAGLGKKIDETSWQYSSSRYTPSETLTKRMYAKCILKGVWKKHVSGPWS